MGPFDTYESELDFQCKHFNLVPSFPGYEIAQRLIFLWCFYSVFRFSFFCFVLFCCCFFCFRFGFLHHCNCNRSPLQEDIIRLKENTKKHLVRVEGKLHVIAYSVHPYTLLYSIVEDYTVRYFLIQHYTSFHSTTQNYTGLHTPNHLYTALYTPIQRYTPLYNTTHP